MRVGHSPLFIITHWNDNKAGIAAASMLGQRK